MFVLPFLQEELTEVDKLRRENAALRDKLQRCA
jgi:hypothetical protein